MRINANLLGRGSSDRQLYSKFPGHIITSSEKAKLLRFIVPDLNTGILVKNYKSYTTLYTKATLNTTLSTQESIRVNKSDKSQTLQTQDWTPSQTCAKLGSSGQGARSLEQGLRKRRAQRFRRERRGSQVWESAGIRGRHREH